MTDLRPPVVTTPDSAPFWEHAAAGELRVQRCDACGSLRLPPGPVCPECWSSDATWVAMSGRGEVSSWIVYKRQYLDAFEVPHAVALVTLDEGPRYEANLLGIEPEDIRAGMRVEVVFERTGDRVLLSSALHRTEVGMWPALEQDRPGPLCGLRVLDLTAFAVGPWAAALIAQLGADVIKVDPPYGDPIRMVRPVKHGESTTYTACNQGKRNIVLDLKDPDDHAIALRLGAEADVVVENARAGALDRLGLGYHDIAAVNPEIVYCSSSSFGDRGPMMTVGSTDPQGQAFSGFVAVTGAPGQPPEVMRYLALIDLATSMYLAQAVLAGVYARRRTGRGQHVLTSQFEASVGVQVTRLSEYLTSRQEQGGLGSSSATIVPSRAFRGADGRYVNVTAHDAATWRSLCAVVGRPELSDDQRFATNADRVANRDALDTELGTVFATRDGSWWTAALARAGVPCGPNLALDDASTHAHLRDAGHVVDVPHPIAGTISSSGPMWRLGRTPGRIDPAPLPGADSERVRAAALTAGAAVTGQVLDGVRVLDLSQGVAGPYCSWLLAGLGADIVRVEPGSGDWMREVGPAGTDGDGAVAAALGHGKRSVAIDLATADGTRVLDALIARADVLLHDLTPLSALSCRLDAASLDDRFPQLVHCALTALGEGGPWSERPATELEIQGIAGIPRYLGRLGEPPVRLGADVAGVLGGCAAVQGIIAALIERLDSGRGQSVAVSQLAALMGMTTVMLAALDAPDEWEGFHCLAATTTDDHGIPTKDGRIYYGQPMRSEEPWQAFCTRIGAHDVLADARLSTRAERMPRQAEVRTALAPHCARFTTGELLQIIADTEGIGVPVNDYGALLDHPQTDAMSIIAVDTAGLPGLSVPWRFTESTVSAPSQPARPVGADTVEVLRDAGFTNAEVDAFVASGVVFTERTPRHNGKEASE